MLCLIPRDVLDEIWDLTELVSEAFLPPFGKYYLCKYTEEVWNSQEYILHYNKKETAVIHQKGDSQLTQNVAKVPLERPKRFMDVPTTFL